MSEIRQKDLKKGFFIIFIFFVIFVYQMVDTINYFSEQDAKVREVKSLESLELLWHSQQWVVRHSNGYCGEIPRQTYFLQIDTANSQLILPVWGSKFPLVSRLYLSGFDLETGQTNWKTNIEMDGASEFRGNSNNVFVVGRGPEPPFAACSPELHYCESAKISAFDVEAGEETWSKLQSNMYSAGIFCANEEIVSIEGVATRSNYSQEVSLNALTGEKIPFQDLSPDVTNSAIETPRDITRLVEELGFEGFAGDYVKQGTYLFFLTRPDKTLRILDRTTSEIVGKAELTGEPLAKSQFEIFVVNEYVVVILGDSQQVFVFRRLPYSPNS